jgi:drug/metabolite transporter (DMT)-like permease
MKERASTGRIVLIVLAVLLGVAAGLGTLLGVAALTSRPPLFLLAGLSGFCAFYLLGLSFATRKVGRDRRRRVREVSFFAGTALVVGLFVLTALLPMDDPRLPPAPVEGNGTGSFPRTPGSPTYACPPRATPAGRP